MEAKELRIGNLVILKRSFYTYKKGDVFTLSNVGVDYLDRWQQMGASDELKTKDIEPIPLTEEWLVRFKENDLTKIIRKNHARNCYSLHTECGYVWIYYVHQLQNLYFALTGEELELK